VLLLVVWTTRVRGRFCDELSEPTWNALIEVIEFSGGFVTLCPFVIEGDGCPSSKGLDVINQNLDLICDREGDEECRIDCPGRHFTIYDGSTLILDRMTLASSRETSVRVMDKGTLVVINSNFDDNRHPSGNGGAIHATAFSQIEILHSNFNRNAALNGGAIYNLGVANLQGCVMEKNNATNGNGGALSVGQGAKTKVDSMTFRGNYAAFYGPAIFDGSGQTESWKNSACENVNGNGITCNGRFSFATTTCEEYDITCTLSPTAEPSTRPSSAPTAVPSGSPTQSPSGSIGPSSLPSSQPSISLAPSEAPSSPPTTTPSLRPSNGPTSNPSSIPSSSPTKVRSEVPSSSIVPPKMPSNMPSQSPVPSVVSKVSVAPSTVPSVVPTSSVEPSAEPSTIPSVVTTTSVRPTTIPSIAPSVVPTSSLRPSNVPSKESSVVPSTTSV